jgi:hypothetical protein
MSVLCSRTRCTNSVHAVSQRLLKGYGVEKVNGGGGAEGEDALGGLDLLQHAVVVDTIELTASTEGGRGDGGDAGGFDEMEESEFERFRAQFLETVSRNQTFSLDNVAFVLLQAVANHGDTAAAHSFLRRVCSVDLGRVLGHDDRQVLEHVLLPLALAFEPLHALRFKMSQLRARAERSCIWTKAAGEAVSAAIKCLVAAGDAHPCLPSAELAARVERVLSEDCAGLAAEAREHVLTLYRAKAPFARVAAKVDALGARLAQRATDTRGGTGGGEEGEGALDLYRERSAIGAPNRRTDTLEAVSPSHPLLLCAAYMSKLSNARGGKDFQKSVCSPSFEYLSYSTEIREFSRSSLWPNLLL